MQAGVTEKTIRESGIRQESCTQGRRRHADYSGAAPVRECLGISRWRLDGCLVLFGVDVTRQPTRGGRRAGASFDLFPGAPQRTAECSPAGPTTHATTGSTQPPESSSCTTTSTARAPTLDTPCTPIATAHSAPPGSPDAHTPRSWRRLSSNGSRSSRKHSPNGASGARCVACRRGRC
jgi:hypothetical protein